jgi:hypothetical protein
MLPHPVPDGLTARLILVSARRMAAFGLHDAERADDDAGLRAAFPQALCLLRAFMLELSQTAERPIALAPVAACA